MHLLTGCSLVVDGFMPVSLNQSWYIVCKTPLPTETLSKFTEIFSFQKIVLKYIAELLLRLFVELPMIQGISKLELNFSILMISGNWLGPIMWTFDYSFVVSLYKLLNKQSSLWWWGALMLKWHNWNVRLPCVTDLSFNCLIQHYIAYKCRMLSLLWTQRVTQYWWYPSKRALPAMLTHGR